MISDMRDEYRIATPGIMRRKHYSFLPFMRN